MSSRVLASSRHWITGLIIVTLVCPACVFASATTAAPAPDRLLLEPVKVTKNLGRDAVEVQINASALDGAGSAPQHIELVLPVGGGEQMMLELERFDVTNDKTRFVIGSPAGDIPFAAPEVHLYRGLISGETGSRAFVGFGADGSANGYVMTASGRTVYIGTEPAMKAGLRRVTVAAADRIGSGEGPDSHLECGVGSPPPDYFEQELQTTLEAQEPHDYRGTQLITVAVDGDYSFTQVFDDSLTAAAYVVQLIAAVSDIYQRDIDARLILEYVRLWSNGGEPFTAQSLGGFRDYWWNNEPYSNYNLISMFSARSDLPYGGVAFVRDACDDMSFNIVSVNGYFPMPVPYADKDNWDLIVVAHEMGHNLGTYHTHDGYLPTIDDCGNGVPSRGTIMSYCHIHTGITANIDLRFHSRVQRTIEVADMNATCLPRDCNGNLVSDAIDIAVHTSADVNGDGVPDECQDCNNNGMLDPDEILQGLVDDVDMNNIPDECESDCNGNGLPDEYETRSFQANDFNGNIVPDECDPDCDGNGTADFVDILNHVHEDYNRNTIPDMCEDCNGNGTTDWVDLGREFNLFVADNSKGYVREFHDAAGYPIQNLTQGTFVPLDVKVGPDLLVYAPNSADGAVLRFDPQAGTAEIFIPTGILTQPSSLTFGPDGNLYVADLSTGEVRRFDAATGSDLGALVTGLTEPYGIAFGPDNNLYITHSSDRVSRYNGSTGAFIDDFVTPGDGGLSSARGLVFLPDGDLVVASRGTNGLLRYDGTTGDFVRVFYDNTPSIQPWGVTVSPYGNVFAVQGDPGNVRVREYGPDGFVVRSFVRADTGLVGPTGLAFMPGSPLDCNGNGYIDSCDIASGLSIDQDANGLPDECQGCCELRRGDVDMTGTYPAEVDSGDLGLLIQYLFNPPGTIEFECLEEADIDAGGGSNPFDSTDLGLLVAFLFNPPGTIALPDCL